jgi:hypothetical protein
MVADWPSRFSGSVRKLSPALVQLFPDRLECGLGRLHEKVTNAESEQAAGDRHGEILRQPLRNSTFPVIRQM